MGRTASTIYNLGYQWKVQQFLKQLKACSVPKKKLIKRVEAYRQNPKRLFKELYTIQKILHDSLEKEKAIYLARVYVALLSDEIDFAIFQELGEIIRRLFMEDVMVLRKIFCGEIKTTKQCNPSQVDRLTPLGLLETGRAALYPGGDGFSPTERNVWTSALGDVFCQVALEEHPGEGWEG